MTRLGCIGDIDISALKTVVGHKPTTFSLCASVSVQSNGHRVVKQQLQGALRDCRWLFLWARHFLVAGGEQVYLIRRKEVRAPSQIKDITRGGAGRCSPDWPTDCSVEARPGGRVLIWRRRTSCYISHVMSRVLLVGPALSIRARASAELYTMHCPASYADHPVGRPISLQRGRKKAQSTVTFSSGICTPWYPSIPTWSILTRTSYRCVKLFFFAVDVHGSAD